MSSRDKALLELKRHMEEQKARLDPLVLEKAQKAALFSQKIADDPSAQSFVPYDREAAARAVQLFLENSDDRKGVEKRLRELLGKTGH